MQIKAHAKSVLRLWDKNKIRVTHANDVAVANMVFESLREALSDDFDRALAFVLKWEGGFSNHPADFGGATNHGVTQEVYGRWRAQKGLSPRSVSEISTEEVHAIYFELYWKEAKCDRMDWPICLIHFDTAVQRGTFRANQMLQRVLGCKDDGLLGPKTFDLLGLADRDCAARVYLADRLKHYEKAVEANPTQRVFLAGWRNRIEALRREACIDE